MKIRPKSKTINAERFDFDPDTTTFTDLLGFLNPKRMLVMNADGVPIRFDEKCVLFLTDEGELLRFSDDTEFAEAYEVETEEKI